MRWVSELAYADFIEKELPNNEFFGDVVRDRRFGIVVEALGVTDDDPVPAIVVERAMYGDAGGVHWAAGTSAVATRLR